MKIALFTRMRCLVAVCIFALLGVPSCATQASANPMQKVVDLLAVLSKQIVAEGAEDRRVYEEVGCTYTAESTAGNDIIKTQGDKIAGFETDLAEAVAFRDGKGIELVDLADRLAKNDADLTAAKDGRKKERALFVKNEAIFMESQDQLERALVVMAKQAPAAASGASLLAIAKKLKTTLQGSEFALSTAQRETLDSFVRSVQVRQAPSFLQTGSHQPYGDFESTSGGVLTTLQDLKTKVDEELAAAVATETTSKTEFTTFADALTTEIENRDKSLKDVKSAISTSQESSSKKQAALSESKEIYETEVAHVAKVEAQYKRKTFGYNNRLSKRADETAAVHEAETMLSSEIAKGYIKKQSVGTSFIQLEQENTAAVRRKALYAIKRATTPGLALLVLKSTVHRAKHGTDPFAKVKTMISGMLSKLKKKEAEESKHNEWCDSEMAKTTKSTTRKGEEVQKLTDRLSALTADLSQVKADIETSTKDMAEIREVSGQANTTRLAEKALATTAIAEYKKAAALLEKACKVLKGYYKNKAGGGSEVNKKEFKQRHGMGTGIIGILEIAVDDFQQLYADTKSSETAAATDFKESQEEAQIRLAVFTKDLEYKGRTKVKLELDESTMQNDLKSVITEKAAIDKYMQELKTSCTVKGPTHAEKVAQREAELASLKEVLTYLTA